MHENKAIFFLVKRQNYAAQDNTNKKLEFSMKYSKIRNEKPFLENGMKTKLLHSTTYLLLRLLPLLLLLQLLQRLLGKKRSKR